MLVGKSYRFGPYRLQIPGLLLYRHDELVPLPPKVAQTLLLLVERAGEMVQKEELLSQVWQGAFVEEGSLARNISVLRKTLGSGEEGGEYIATLSKRGYRFVAPVQETANSRDSAAERKIMLAVLPFQNLSGDPEREYFSDGLTEEMITQLSRLNPDRLGVIARTSAMMFKGTKKRIREIGKELGVGYLLEGSVRRSENRVRISAQLVVVADETQVWAESFERSFGDVLILQSEVARAIAQEIQVQLTPREERRLARAEKVSAEAYEAYLKGRHSWNKRTEQGMRKSIEYYEQAIQLHSDYAMAHAGMADSYVMLACRGMVPAKDSFRRFDQAIAVLNRVEEIHPDHFLPHLRMGLVRIQKGQYAQAITALEKAVRLANHSTETQAALALAHAARGDRKTATRLTGELEACEAERYVLPYNIAKIYAAGGHKEKCFAWLEKAYEEGNPDLIELNSEPVFDGLRGNARFSDLMQRVGWRMNPGKPA